MGDLKPLGSEKLTGQDKIKRIMEIARYKENMPTKLNEKSKTEYSIGLSDGQNYQIVKEKLGYIIKKTISESQTDYIEPIKNRKYYSSYSQALKRLNLLSKELNRINENEKGTELFGDKKKYVLKTKSGSGSDSGELGEQGETEEPVAPPAAPPAVPTPALPDSPLAPEPLVGPEGMPTPPSDDMGGEEMGVEGEEMGSEEEEMMGKMKGEMGGEEVNFKTIQKLTGKLTQKIRVLDNQEGMTSENIKYVINMVLSALDLQNLNEEDKEDIIAKFDEESEDFGGDDMEGEDFTDDTEVEDIQSQMDVPVQGLGQSAEPEGGEMKEYSTGAIFDSIFRESKVDKVISNYFEISKKEIVESSKKKAHKMANRRQLHEQKLNKVSQFSETIEQELAAKKFLEENKSFKFIGKTNKKNLVFENEGGKIIISPRGILL
jgi:hypothetical protein